MSARSIRIGVDDMAAHAVLHDYHHTGHNPFTQPELDDDTEQRSPVDVADAYAQEVDRITMAAADDLTRRHTRRMWPLLILTAVLFAAAVVVVLVVVLGDDEPGAPAGAVATTTSAVVSSSVEPPTAEITADERVLLDYLRSTGISISTDEESRFTDLARYLCPRATWDLFDVERELPWLSRSDVVTVTGGIFNHCASLP